MIEKHFECVASHIGESLRMALSVHEALIKSGITLRAEVGVPLSWEQLENKGGRQQLTDFLYQQVQVIWIPESISR